MQSSEIRQRFLDFFQARGHQVVASSSLVPEGDGSVLLTTAGMQQFKPYYTGDKNALTNFNSQNVVSVQKCVRTSDIDEVGDDTHLSFFEMLGNFSFGGYGREEAITYAHDFITKELNLKISYVTFYQGSDNVPRDTESEKIWRDLGVGDVREDGSDVFWGPTGNSGPCGPTTEIYCQNTAGDDVEIWNIVFNEYFCDGTREQLDRGEAKLAKLSTMGIDTGMGFERLLAIIQNTPSVYQTDLFELSNPTPAERIVADHVRTAVFLIADGVEPANTDRGYILRRLIRRAVRHAKSITTNIHTLANQYISKYGNTYENLTKQRETILATLNTEIDKFSQTLANGLREFEKGTDPFDLYQSYGFPIELTEELAKERGQLIDKGAFYQKLEAHQTLSRQGAEQKFKGGLADESEQTIKYHTATHLLHQALHDVLGDHVEQKGSNITIERLRFDFTHPQKMTDDEKARVEQIVNNKIGENLPVVAITLPKEAALATGARHSFNEKYGDTVMIYYIGENLDNAYCKEFCGGPHVERTGTIGQFKIAREEAVSAGVRRIKATLQ